MKKNSPYNELAKNILAVILTKPEDLEIKEDEEGGIINVSLKVAKEDMGRVIGKDGKIIKAIRNLLRIRAIKEGEKINLSLVE